MSWDGCYKYFEGENDWCTGEASDVILSLEEGCQYNHDSGKYYNPDENKICDDESCSTNCEDWFLHDLNGETPGIHDIGTCYQDSTDPNIYFEKHECSDEVSISI